MLFLVRYHTILFDADNTLLDFLASEREALSDALRLFEVEPTDDIIKTYSRINSEMWKRLERGEITKDALRELRFEEFCRFYGFELDVPRLSSVYTEYLAGKIFLMDGALETCRALFEKCRLFVITNGMASVQRGRFDPSPLAPLFQGAFISDVIGVEKPNQGFFDYVKQHVPDFCAADTLVVGDSLTSDIAGGIAAGIDTCWFNPEKKPVPAKMPITYTIHELKELLPLVLG